MRGDRGLLDELARHRRVDAVVGVLLVILEHRELGRVGGVGPFVAEVAVDLEHSLHATDDAALEEQLWRDAQVEVHVEGVGVRDERACGSAAVQRLKHRRLDLEEATSGEARAKRRHHGDAQPRNLARLRPHDEVDVALTYSGLLGQRLVLDRERAQRLGREDPRVGQHAELAAT